MRLDLSYIQHRSHHRRDIAESVSDENPQVILVRWPTQPTVVQPVAEFAKRGDARAPAS